MSDLLGTVKAPQKSKNAKKLMAGRIVESLAQAASSAGVPHTGEELQTWMAGVSGELTGTEYNQVGEWLEKFKEHAGKLRELALMGGANAAGEGQEEPPQDDWNTGAPPDPNAGVQPPMPAHAPVQPPMPRQAAPVQVPAPAPKEIEMDESGRPIFPQVPPGQMAYVNTLLVNRTLFDFTLAMGTHAQPGTVPGPENFIFFMKMSPTHLKDMVCILLEQIAEFERDFGTIPSRFEMSGSIKMKGVHKTDPTVQ